MQKNEAFSVKTRRALSHKPFDKLFSMGFAHPHIKTSFERFEGLFVLFFANINVIIYGVMK